MKLPLVPPISDREEQEPDLTLGRHPEIPLIEQPVITKTYLKTRDGFVLATAYVDSGASTTVIKAKTLEVLKGKD